VEFGNIKNKESHESLSSSFPEYVSSSISFSKQIEMMDIQSISKLSKENLFSHQHHNYHSMNSIPTNSFLSEKSIPQTPSRSFMSRSSKRPSFFSKAASFTSRVHDQSPTSMASSHIKSNHNNVNGNISNSNSNNNTSNININIDHHNNDKKKKKKEKLPSQSDIILCIQMQLCQATLYDYIQDRNNMLNESSDLVDDKGYPLIDEEENYHIWCDIVEGVRYIHSKGLIHRYFYYFYY